MIGLSLMITIEALLPRREHPFEVPSLRRREDPLTQSPYVLFDSTPLNLVPVTENVLGSVHQVGVVDGRRRSIRRHGVQLVPRFCPLSSSSLHRLTRPTSALFRVQASARYPIGYAGGQRRSDHAAPGFPLPFGHRRSLLGSSCAR